MKTIAYGLEDGLAKLPEFARGSRANIFAIQDNDEEFLSAILHGGVPEEVKKNYESYFSSGAKLYTLARVFTHSDSAASSLMPYIAPIFLGTFEAAIIFDNESLPKKYAEELEKFKNAVPTLQILLKQGRYFPLSYDWDPESLESSFAIFDNHLLKVNYANNGKEIEVMEKPWQVFIEQLASSRCVKFKSLSLKELLGLFAYENMPESAKV